MSLKYCIFIELALSIMANSASLKRESYLSAPWYFLNVDSTLRFMDVSLNTELQSGAELFKNRTPSIPGAPIVVLPNNDHFFVGTYNKLIKFNHQFKIVEEIPLSRLSLKEGIHSFIGQAEASENSLWITVCEKYSGQQGPYERYFVLKWDYNDELNRIQKSPEFSRYCHWALNREKNIIYIPGKSTVAYNYMKEVQDHFDLGDYSYADYSQYGLLLSEFPFKKNKKIKYINLSNFQETLLDEGSLANWCYDGMIYYCKGSTQLCLTDTTGKLKETLYSATRDVQYGNWLIDIDVNNERNMLSFIYTVPSIWGDRTSFILVDVKEKKYRDFPNKALGTLSAGWLKRMESSSDTKGASVSIFDAIRETDEELIREIILSGIDINQENKYGFTPLACAIATEDEDIIKYLISKGANVNSISSSSGRTPLHSAVRCDVKIIEILLEKGANPNISDKDGRTPLYDAVAVSSLQKVKILIKYGAKKEIKDKESISPLQLAKTHDLQEIVSYLEHN